MKPWIATFTDKKFDLLKPTAEMIDIRDIAHALAYTCRFGGHSKPFYSVAQHSILVADHCCPRHQLQGLLHDATEAYYGDMTRPLKSLFPLYREMEASLMSVIAEALEVSLEECSCVKTADEMLLATEAYHLLGGKHLEEWTINARPIIKFTFYPMSPEVAEQEFLHMYKDLRGGTL